MKKAVLVFLVLCMAPFFLTVKASAAELTGEYSVSQVEGGYILMSDGVKMGEFSDISSCMAEIFDPTRIIFDNVSSDEPFELPSGEYTLGGNLRSCGVITVPRGANIILNEISLSFTGESYLRIKGGAVTVNSSDITGESMLIRLDYSSGASLTVNSGVISGKCEEPLIDVRNGSTYIFGGNIENKSGVAIKSDSELVFAGSPSIKGTPYSVILESPMHLSAGELEYLSEDAVAVQYLAEFLDGTLTEVFYSASARSVKNVCLYDQNGKEVEITQFDSTHHVTEKNFAGVYLPYTVSFFVDDVKVHEEKVLGGERLEKYTHPAPTGYVFDNWYEDREATSPYSFNTRIYSSFSLFGMYELMPPSFSISSMEFVYDGREHMLGFDNLSHQLQGGYYTYLWYRDGEEISTLSSLKIKNVGDSGSYSCLVTYVYNGKTASSYAENIKINVMRKEISLPNIPSVEYTGNLVYPGIASTSYYKVEMTPGIDVGVYQQALTLTDSENTKWVGSDNAIVYVSFEITKAENKWIEPPCFSDSYIGFPLKGHAVSKFGEVVYLYSATESGVYKADAPTSAGTYYAKAQVAESKNYSGLTSEPLVFSILPEDVVGISIVSMPSVTEYPSFATLNLNGLSVKAVYNSGREEIIENQRLNVIYNNGSSLRMGDASVTLEYLSATVILPVTVVPLSYDLGGFLFEDFSVVYDGAYHSYDKKFPEIIGRDGVLLEYEIIGGGTNAGEYLVTVNFSTESSDYIVPDSITVKMTVLPLEVELLWDNTSFVYDGSSHIPTATFTDALGVTRTVAVSGSKVTAGENYIAEAQPYSDNYIYRNPNIAFSVAKADYDMSGTFWSASSLTYTGAFLEVTLMGLPSGVSVVGYTDNRAINAGEYLATASISYDSKNYNQPLVPSYTWYIIPAEYDISGFEFIGAEYEYDGEIKYPTLNGSLPVGADGIPLRYSFSVGAKNVSDGTVITVITFITESKNYFAPAPTTATVKITPKGIYVLWNGESFIYDGKSHSPEAESPYAEIKVSADGVNAGLYTAVAESKDSNYFVVNDTYSYEIKKAENFWLESPSISDFYESKSPNPTAIAHYGQLTFKYYSDETLNDDVFDLTHGTYFMVAEVLESENYLALTSSPIRFTVLEVLPIDIRVEIISDLKAFETMEEDDFNLYLVYNDGSEALITDGVTIEYENSDSLLRKDDTVKFSYSDFKKEIPITVKKATYDLSLLGWDKTEVIYNGEMQAPILQGLPSGITLLGYSENAKSAAGTYVFIPIVSYDEENYEKPEIPGCIFIIKKATVPNIENVTVEYSGSPFSIYDTELYASDKEYSIVNAGEYEIVYKLKDPENYIFENGSDTSISKVTVVPKIINITVSDFDLYLFESEISPEYYIDGNIADGDDLELYVYLEGDNIYLRSENANYDLNIQCGKLNRINHPNESTSRRILLIAFVLFAITIFAYIVYRKRESILDAIYMAKAKKRDRAYIGYIDNGKQDNILPMVDIIPEKEKIETDVQDLFNEEFPMEEPDITAHDEKAKDNETELSKQECEDLEDSINFENIDEIDPEEKEEEIESEIYKEESGEHRDEFETNNSDNEIRITEEPTVKIKMEDADEMLTDSMAKEMIKGERECVYTDGKSRSIINVDTLSRNFIADDRIDVNVLKRKSLVPYDTAYIKVLARGAIDKPLHVYANDFSLSAVKMILLSGGEAKRVVTINKGKNKTKR